MNSYRELVVWQRGMELVEELYKIVRFLPKEEMYALSDQMRRAAVSIPSNISEGFARKAPKDYARFLLMARGSKYELETQLIICERLKYLSADDIKRAMGLCDEIGKMLNSIIAKL